MKLIVISVFREGYGGGCGRVAHDMARQFSARHEVVLVCPADTTGLLQTKYGFQMFGVKSAGSGHACVPLLSRKNVNALYDFLDEFSPDVVHAHDPVSLSLMGQVWAAMSNVPFVYTAHILPTKSLEFGASRVFGFLPESWTETMSRQMTRDFMRNCDAVIALNQPAADDIRRIGCSTKILIIPNGRDVERLGTCPIADLSSETKVLTFVGFISRRKNQLFLVEMLQRLPRNYRLQIIGDALEPECEEQIRAWVAEKGLDNVILTGSVPHSEIPNYLARSHLFVSASKMEVQSLSVIEALASGTPVVGLSNETIDELVDDQVGLRLHQDTSPEQFARRVEAICSMPQAEYDRLCGNARRRVAHLSWPRVESQTMAAYAQLIESRPQRSDLQIIRLIKHISPQEVQSILADRLMRLNRTLRQKVHPHSRLGLLARMAYANQISGTTWFYVELTRFVSSFLGELT